MLRPTDDSNSFGLTALIHSLATKMFVHGATLEFSSTVIVELPGR